MTNRVTLMTAVLAAVLILAGCGSEPADKRHSDTFLAFGTLVDVTIQGVDQAAAREAIDAVKDDFQYMHETWHAWEPGALGRVNQLLATTESFSVAPSVQPLMVRAKALSRRSQGLFNPAIGQLVELWGFHSELPEGPPPDEAAIQALLDKAPSMDDVEMNGVRARSTNAAVQLDFGAFAKGYGVDQALDHLRELGIDNALVNTGGDMRALGDAGGRPWRIGVRHPRGEGVLAAIELGPGEAVFTSGDYERLFEYEGRRYHHILDPRTGRPARGTQSVTVIHDEGAAADAAATALFVAGPDQWRSIARAMGIEYVMLVDADGVVHMNPAMAERVEFQDVEPETRISAPL